MTVPEVKVLENLTEEEAYLFAILSDPSGLDAAEFLWVDQSSEDHLFCPQCGTEKNGVHLRDHRELEPTEWEKKYSAASSCFRAWAFQWTWWRDRHPLQIDQAARSIGKSLSIMVRACAFPFLFAGQEMIITAPELVHLEPIVTLIESRVYSTRLLREMIPVGRSAVTHRPFQLQYRNGARLIGRIPQRDGKGVKGCVEAGTLILTDTGHKRADQIRTGDRVLTHTGHYGQVIAVHEDENDCYEVRGQCSFPMTVSCDHRFLGSENTATRKQKRKLLPLTWHDVESLTDHQIYWASPTEFPSLPIPPLIERGTAIALDQGSQEYWWLVGRYLADGYLTRNRKTGRELRVHWVAPGHKQQAILNAIEAIGGHSRITERQHSSAATIELGSAPFCRWLENYCGRLADGKRLPAFVLGMPERWRRALLDGYLAGDGHFLEERGRWEVGTASKTLAAGVQLLAQSLGYTVNCTSVQPNVTHVNGVALKATPKMSWRLQIGHGYPVEVDGYLVGKVKSVEPVGTRKVYNIIVEGDHSYLTGSVMSHNIHPIWLELDEASDYPHAGWVELNETLKRGWEGATWHAHGVTRGVRDDFYNYTQESPDNPWKVHRICAMWRPNWTDRERQEAIQKYGSREDPDYRRNVLGLHGDKTNPIFVLTALMRVTDNDKLSDYNANEYFKVTTKSEQLELFEQDITDVLTYPAGHLLYAGRNPRQRLEQPQAHYWIGMDLGFTIDPSEILVAVEYRKKPTDANTVLKLLTRVSMVRMPHRSQMQAILHTIDYYRPQAFALDKGGVGLSLYQELSEHMEAFRNRDLDKVPKWMHGYDLEMALTTIKGYHFGEKVLVDIDPAIEVGPYDTTEDRVAKAGMRRNAKEYSTDILRELVDAQRLWLPWDDDLLKQFQGGTWMSSRSMDAYGRRTFSSGNDHVLDAARMLALGWSLNPIEEMTKKTPSEPVLDSFMII